MKTSQPATRRSIFRLISSSGKLQITLLTIFLSILITFVFVKFESGLKLTSQDEKYVKEFLEILESRRRNESIRAKARRFKVNSNENVSRVAYKYPNLPKVSDYFEIPKDIFNNKWLGEGGLPIKFPTEIPENIQKIIKKGYEVHEFNQYLSDLISVRRSLPDKRSNLCRKARKKYRKKLPSTSIIIIFHNEAWSTLLRSVHSILDRTPYHLIHEILLIDDSSTLDYLKSPLENYMKHFEKVKILRMKKREGISRARIRGTLKAKGGALAFLDSHVEVTEGWLEPLLDRVVRHPNTIVSPLIDRIHDHTFELISQSYLEKVYVGGFSWSLNFEWVPLSKLRIRARHSSYDPVPTPTIAGGLFVIDRIFFRKLGMYDPQYKIWGSENLELSFKSWMCGGRLEIVPCSRVAHVYRKKSPYHVDQETIRDNKRRLANSWLDEYVDQFYLVSGIEKKIVDVTDQLKLREKLKCKSFKWYLEHVYPEFPMPEKMTGHGQIRSIDHNKCLKARPVHRDFVTIETCKKGGSQYWEYHNGMIKQGAYHLSVNKHMELIMLKSKPLDAPSFWSYNENYTTFQNEQNYNCLTLEEDDNYLSLQECDFYSNTTKPIDQQWEIENFNPKLNKEWWYE